MIKAIKIGNKTIEVSKIQKIVIEHGEVEITVLCPINEEISAPGAVVDARVYARFSDIDFISER